MRLVENLQIARLVCDETQFLALLRKSKALNGKIAKKGPLSTLRKSFLPGDCALSRKIRKDWNACENYQHSVSGAWPIADEGVAQQSCGDTYENCRDERISPHAIGAR